MNDSYCTWCGDELCNPSEAHPRVKDLVLCKGCATDYDSNFHCPGCGSDEDIYEIHTARAQRCVSISALGKVSDPTYSEVELMEPGEEPIEVLYYICYNCNTRIDKDEIDPTKKIEAAQAELKALLDSI